jgi:hypothetical protein
VFAFLTNPEMARAALHPALGWRWSSKSEKLDTANGRESVLSGRTRTPPNGVSMGTLVNGAQILGVTILYLSNNKKFSKSRERRFRQPRKNSGLVSDLI